MAKYLVLSLRNQSSAVLHLGNAQKPASPILIVQFKLDATIHTVKQHSVRSGSRARHTNTDLFFLKFLIFSHEKQPPSEKLRAHAQATVTLSHSNAQPQV